MIDIQPKVSVIVLGEHHGETIIYETLQEKLTEYAKNYQIKFLGEANIPSIDDNIRSKEIVYPKSIPFFKQLEKIYKDKGRTSLEIEVRKKLPPQFVNIILSVLLNYNGYRAKKECIDSLKKAEIDYVCVDNVIDRQESDQYMALGIPDLQFNMREKGMAKEISAHIENCDKSTLIVVTTGFLHSEKVAKMLQDNFVNHQQVKIISGVFGRGYRDEKGNTIRPDEVQAKDGPEIIKLLEDGLSNINKIELSQFTVPNWCEEKAKLVESLGGKIVSLDTEGNAIISIDSSKLKGQRAKLEIYTAQKILNIQTAKEQITALRSLGDEITIECLSGNKIQVTAPIKYKETLTEILDNFTQYKSSQNKKGNDTFAGYVGEKQEEQKINQI